MRNDYKTFISFSNFYYCLLENIKLYIYNSKANNINNINIFFLAYKPEL